MTVLCLSPHCYTTDEGLLVPCLAADGLALCWTCTNRIGQHAIRAAELYDELALALDQHGLPGETRPPNKPGSREPNEAAVWARAHIRHTLVSWCRLVAEERGMNLPHDDVLSVARYLDAHAQWLAARDFAGEVCTELYELAYGRGRAVAYPSGGRSYQIKDPAGQPVPCPGQECGGTLWAILRRADSLLPSELACDVDDTHRLPSTDWLAYGKQWREKEEAA